MIDKTMKKLQLKFMFAVITYIKIQYAVKECENTQGYKDLEDIQEEINKEYRWELNAPD